MLSGFLIFLAGAISLPVRKIKAWEERQTGVVMNPDAIPAPAFSDGKLGDSAKSDPIGSSGSKKNAKTKTGSGVKFVGSSYERLPDEVTVEMHNEASEAEGVPNDFKEAPVDETEQEVEVEEEEEEEASESQPLSSH